MKRASMVHKISQLRRPHNHHELSERAAPSDPLPLFDEWIQAAMAAQPEEPNAMTLATAAKSGRPSCRIVLLKDYSADGFVFFTNYDSRKGKELAQNPQASLLFYWPALSRQVIIEGRVKK